MKTFRQIFALIFFSLCTLAQDVDIGQEQIKPIEFPKFTLSSDYSVGRFGKFLGEDNISANLPSEFGAGISFDVGLFRYFNAGAGFSATFGNVLKSEPIYLRFDIFGKPVIRLHDRVSIFGRFGVGPSILIVNPIRLHRDISTARVVRAMDRIYGEQQYAELGPGVHGSALIGVEAFPFSRFGIAIEFGVRADFFYLGKSDLLEKISKQKFSKASAPASIKYFSYEFPIMLSLHIIL